jgi:hypothetical protein
LVFNQSTGVAGGGASMMCAADSRGASRHPRPSNMATGRPGDRKNERENNPGLRMTTSS